MATRREATLKLAKLIIEMTEHGEQPIGDFLKRSDHEQAYLFTQKVTKCDGVIRRSAHQNGKALDIYLWNEEKQDVDQDWDKDKSDYWHKVWVEEYGGKPRTEFTLKDENGNDVLTIDHPHFEI